MKRTEEQYGEEVSERMEKQLDERYAEYRRKGDPAGAARLLAKHPEMAADQEWSRLLIHMHALAGEADFVRVLLDAGVGVNAPESNEQPDRPIVSATSAGSAEVVRLLLERGSDVNWGWGGGPTYCVPLARAIRDGQSAILRMLVEAGGRLGVIDRAGHTPLSWAVAYGRQEIADYLRSKGALMPADVQGYAPPVRLDPISYHVSGEFALSEGVLARRGEVAVRVGLGEVRQCLFTVGMSARVMTVPPGGEAYGRAELVCYHPDTSLEDERFLDPELAWVVDWMLRLSRWPFDHGTWLNGKWSVVSNEDPPRPLSESTEMTCWLLLGEKEPLARAELPGGESVCFYTLMPIHTAERDLALRDGVVALLRLFAEHDVPEYLDPGRESVV